MNIPTLPFIVKADFTLYRKKIGVLRVVLALALIGFIFFRFGVLVGTLTAAFIVALILTAIWTLSQRTLIATQDGLEYKNAFGTKRTISYKDIKEVTAYTQFYELSFGTYPKLLIHTDKAQFLSLSGLFWNTSQLTSLIEILKKKPLVVSKTDEPMTAAMIARQSPAGLSFIERKPILTGSILAVIVTVIIFIIVLIPYLT